MNTQNNQPEETDLFKAKSELNLKREYDSYEGNKYEKKRK
jgi:hypothetical protein